MPQIRVVIVGAVTALLLAPAPAGARLVFVRGEATLAARIFGARDDGSHAARIASGYAPRVSPNGRWVAYVHLLRTRSEVRLIPGRGGRARRVLRSGRIDELRFSPDSRRLGVSTGRALKVYDVGARLVSTIVTGAITGFSWGPDSLSLVWGRARRQSLTAPTDLYRFAFGGPPRRITSDGVSLEPLWTASEIVYDRRRLRGSDNTPAYELYGIRPDGTGRRRITHTRVPALAFGLVPVAASANGRRVLAEFAAQDEADAHAVNAVTGTTRRLERKLIPGALSSNGGTVLAQTGGPNPADRHDVVAVAWRGGRAKVLAPRASSPHWSR